MFKKVLSMPRLLLLIALFFGILGATSLYSIEHINAETMIAPTSEQGFVPHKAVYKIKLVSTKSGSQIINIDGDMTYEWTPSCEAWNTQHRFNLNYEYADAPPMRITSDFSTYEPFSGQSLNFTSQRKRNKQVFEEIRGYAALDADQNNKAHYTIPEGLSYDLPEDTLFPMQHTLNVLNQIKKGKRFFKATIFDGSDQDGPIEINAFLGKKAELVKSDDTLENIDFSLLNNQSWKLRLGFFPLKHKEEIADYEMSLIFHENGIIRDMIVEYKDFSVSQKLISLKKLNSTCDTTNIQK